MVVVATLLDEAVHFLPLLSSLMEPPQLVLEAVDNKLIHLVSGVLHRKAKENMVACTMIHLQVCHQLVLVMYWTVSLMEKIIIVSQRVVLLHTVIITQGVSKEGGSHLEFIPLHHYQIMSKKIA